MQGSMTIIKSSGLTVFQPFTEKPTLEEFQAIVGGNIELIPGFVTLGGAVCIAYCNEEGKLNKLPFNATATALWDEATGGAFDDILVGDVVVITGDEELMEAM
jgi:hypothetical protein